MTAIVCTAIVVAGIVILFSVKMGLRYSAQLDGLDEKPEPCPELHGVKLGIQEIPGNVRCELLAGHSGPHTVRMNNKHIGFYPYYWHTKPKKLESGKEPETGMGFFVREGDVLLYIDEHGNGFRKKLASDGLPKWVRHPSGADVADQLEHQRIFDRHRRWEKLQVANQESWNVAHDSNRLPTVPKTGFSKSADGKWIVYIDDDGKEYRQSAGYGAEWYNFPDGDEVSAKKWKELQELLQKHTATRDVEQRRNKWAAKSGS